MWLSVHSQVSHEPSTHTCRMSSNFCTSPPASESLPSLWYLSKLPLLTTLLLFPDLAWLPLHFMITLSVLCSTEATRSFPQSENLPFMENKENLEFISVPHQLNQTSDSFIWAESGRGRAPGIEDDHKPCSPSSRVPRQYEKGIKNKNKLSTYWKVRGGRGEIWHREDFLQGVRVESAPRGKELWQMHCVSEAKSPLP